MLFKIIPRGNVGQNKSIGGFILLIMIVGIGKLAMFWVMQAANPESIFSPDSASYTQTALAFLKTGHWAVSPDTPDVPQVERTPGCLSPVSFSSAEKRILP